jgi:E3 ubiquitin-protein ligase XBAT32/33
MAALNGHVESVQLLLDLGASLSEITEEDGTTIDLIGNSFSLCLFGR